MHYPVQGKTEGKIFPLFASKNVYYLCGLDLTNRFHVAERLFSNRSQMRSKCGKNKEVAHEPQASVSLMFLPHFDVLCDLLLNRPTATGNLFVYTMIRKENRPTQTCLVSLDCYVRGFVLVKAFFKFQTLFFFSASSFFFIVFVYSFSEKFFNIFSCSKQNNDENSLQNGESLVAILNTLQRLL